MSAKKSGDVTAETELLADVQRPDFPNLVRPVFVLGASSLIGILISVGLAKAWALLLGPSAYGLAALMQSALSLGAIVSGLGAGQALVRESAHAIDLGEIESVDASRSAAMVLVIIASCTMALALIVFRGQLAAWLLGSRTNDTDIAIIAPAVVVVGISTVQSSILTAHHQVKSLALLGVASSAAYAVPGIPLVAILGEPGIAPSILAGSVLYSLLTILVVHRRVGPFVTRPKAAAVRREAARLVKFGLPYAASSCVGTGTLMLMPVIVLHLLNTASVGFYNAAVAISVGYVTVVTTALSQEYFPRLSSIRSNRSAVALAANEQMRIVRLAGAPILFFALASAPLGITILYSRRFTPAVIIFSWMVVADSLRLPSWTMAWAILSVGGSKRYLLLEAIGGLCMVAGTVLGIEAFGLPGIGVGFLASYAAYYGVAWGLSRLTFGFRLTTSNALWTLVILVGSFTVECLAVAHGPFRSSHEAVAVTATFLASTLAVYVFWQEHERHRGVVSTDPSP